MHNKFPQRCNYDAHDSKTSGCEATHRIADFAVSFTLESAPRKVLENAKTAILDCLGVAVLATTQEIGQCLLAFARENAGQGSCTVWGTAVTTGPRDAALLNGTLAHGLDFDDRHHSSTYTLATSIAAVESLDLSGARVLEAFIVGREVRNTLDALFGHRSGGIGPGAKGWHSNGILGPIASACSASKALGLNRTKTLAAIGLAVASCGALTRDGGTMAKPFRTGHAASTGLLCALLARSGFSSDATAIEGRYGLLEALGPLPQGMLQSLGSDLGSKFFLETTPRIKAYSSCSATHAALEAMLRLTQKHSITPNFVESIECDLKPYPLVRQHPQRDFEGRFSMPFCLAMAVIHGCVRPDDFVDQNVNNPTVQELIRRTHHTPGSSSLIVTLKDGSRTVEVLEHARGLMGREEIERKFRNCVSGTLKERDGEIVVELISQLETLPSIKLLTKALQPETV